METLLQRQIFSFFKMEILECNPENQTKRPRYGISFSTKNKEKTLIVTREGDNIRILIEGEIDKTIPDENYIIDFNIDGKPISLDLKSKAPINA